MRGSDVPGNCEGEDYSWIVEGGEYVFRASAPDHATGQRYRVLKFVLDVPSYQRKVLVEGLTGKDRGLWFVCTFENFRVRYEPYIEEP